MAQREPKVLTFDVVGTLIDFQGGMLNYIRSACGPAGGALDGETFLEHYRRTRGNAKPMRFPDDLSRVYEEVAPALGLPRDPALAEGFVHSIRGWPAFPDSVEALRRLGRRYKLVAMTDAQRWALEHMGRTLGSPFHDTLTVDGALCGSPSRSSSPSRAGANHHFATLAELADAAEAGRIAMRPRPRLGGVPAVPRERDAQ